MSKRSPETRLDSVSVQRRRQLRRASDRLAVVLQSLDLETETQLANEVVEAIKATDRAYELEAVGAENGRQKPEHG